MFNLFSHLRNRHFLFIDFAIFLITPLLALTLRLDGSPSLPNLWTSLAAVTGLFMVVKFAVSYSMGMYRRMWQHAGIDELGLIVFLTISIGIFDVIAFLLFRTVSVLPPLPRSLPYIDTLLTGVLLGFFRMTVRLAMRADGRLNGKHCQRTLIIGAGQAGISLLADMQKSPELGYKPVGLIDDDPDKKGMRVRGVSVVGNRTQISEVVKNMAVRKIIIAIPSAPGDEIRKIIEQCKDTRVDIKTIPSLSEIIDGEVKAHSIRDININDLLRRNPIETNCENVAQYIKGKCVLVTGGGGSIGSELCRQIFDYQPQKLVLVGHGENSIFAIQQELLSLAQSRNQKTEIIAKIADIRHMDRLCGIFSKYQPQIVFHAAAHKHVPLMEENPIEAITNNVQGTNNVLTCAEHNGVKKFIMISTDKAVNPTSVMGVTKRIAETLVIKRAVEKGLSYLCVRFGNVLGSNGSVVPTFSKQIANGGPVTVTHPDVKRFFMTIPEAVQLVLQAASIGQGGEVFVLNMGEPIKIVDLAKDLIRLSGYSEEEIGIKFTGLRPGEKLFEELFIKGEEYKKTTHEKIFIASNASAFVPETVKTVFNDIDALDDDATSESLRDFLKSVIAEYTPMVL
jgi:FlaA1/EpsC-like NDP-sugar epimerase